MTDETTPHYHGHRARLRERFMAGGAEALADYELLELVLFLAIPRGDVKPVAKAIIQKFGSLGAALAATPEELKTIAGIGDAAVVALKTMRAVALRALKEEAKKADSLSGWDKLMDYCVASLGHAKAEEFHVLFLDTKRQLIADELQTKGTINQAAVYPREVIKRALELNAASIVLLHNHPSGDPQPSRQDILVTHEIIKAGHALGVEVYDHIIVGQNTYQSFRTLKLLH